MEITESVYAFPQKLELGDMEEQIHPLGLELEDGLMLVDPGLPGKMGKLEEELEEHGFYLEDVEKVLLTHQDFDHAGVLAELLEKTDATVFAHEADAPAIDGREEPIKGDERYPAARVDVELSGGETFHTEAGELQVLHTPGHTPGHCSLLLDERILFAGDALNVEQSGLAGPRDRFTPDIEEAAHSMHEIAFESFGRTFCFHGGSSEHGADKVREIADEMVEEFDGYVKSSGERGQRFLRREVPNTAVGLSEFSLEAGEAHGSQESPEKGHRHSRQHEIYYFLEGSGQMEIGSETVNYTKGDAVLVHPPKFRRIVAEESTVFVAAGAPVDDGVETE
jgi:glyoxylase-like metal-dependent hydrolase (beta-lactamase superfamily II)